MPLRAPTLAALVLAAAALLLLTRLGATGLWAPDEPRYAEVAEELRAFDAGWRGLVVLHLNGEPYDQKPPLYFWLAALAGAPLGRVTEAAARLPSALAGIGCVALCIGFGARLVGARRAALAAALLLTSQEFAHLSRRVQLDVVLTLFEGLALYAFWRLDRGIGSARANLWGLHAAFGLGVLVKGPVGFLLPLLGIGAFLAWERRPRELFRLLAPGPLVLSLGPGLAWAAAAVALTPSGYFDGAIVDNLVGRFFRGTSHPRPFWYFFYNFPLLFLPWSLLWPLIWPAARTRLAPGADPERARAWRFLLAIVATSFVFFSLSTGKRSLYLLPVAPAAALLTADALALALARLRDTPAWLTRPAGGLAALLAVVGFLTLLAGPALPFASIPRGLGVALLAIAAAATLAWRAAAQRARPWGPVGVLVAAVLATELALFTLLFPALDPDKSPRALAEAAAAVTPPGERIGLVGNDGLIGGIAYYGHRRVAPLSSPEDLPCFFADGGRAAVMRARDVERIAASQPIEERARARRGRRALVVVTPLGGTQAPARP